MFHGTTPTDKAERKLFTNVDSILFIKSQFKITKDFFNGLIRAMLINVNCNNVKDRQHRSRGGCTFSFIVHELNRVEYCTIYQMKATIFLYPLILNSK